MDVVIERRACPSPAEAEVEIVERKGLGHPDSICDALAEEFSRALCFVYLERAGQILHHNVDKALLVAGSSEPHFGGGLVVEPMQMILAGRAALEFEGKSIDVAEIGEEVVRTWIAKNLHCYDAGRDVLVSTAVRPGSAELIDLVDGRGRPSANDTSCGVGFAPLSEVEQMVLAIEQAINSRQTRATDPALGEDVKVMAVRRGDSIRVVLACAMIDAALDSMADYAAAKSRAAEIALDAARKVTSLPVTIEVNAGDDMETGQIYLTVTGTSAEAGDDGQAGRGNRANGLITPCRPMTMESVSGKNPITHVGKLYNLAANLISERIVNAGIGIENVECRMVSAIGRAVGEPEMVDLRLSGPKLEANVELDRELTRLVREELRGISEYAGQLLNRSLRLDDWPLRTSL